MSARVALLESESDAPFSRPSLYSVSLGTLACENIRVRRFVIVAFLAAGWVSNTLACRLAPFDEATGSLGMESWGKPGFPSWECSVEVESDGDGVGGARCVSVLAWPLIARI